MMKLVKINTKSLKLSPKRFFSKKNSPSKSDPPSFGSGTTSSSSSSTDLKGGLASATPTSVLPEISGDLSDFSAESFSDLAEAFRLMDRDKTGVVSRKELAALLSRLGGSGADLVAAMLSEVDGDGEKDEISVEAIVSRVGSACGADPAGDSELREVFESFDADGDGKITAQELLEFFAGIGDERCTLEECRRMIAGVDTNGDGFVCFEDFSRMMDLQRLS